ncbi:MAG: hypothetical protein K1X57_16395 [Gemmataceae bacterium]|nr:hypothetical protein [Gemmataceae bacterium]
MNPQFLAPGINLIEVHRLVDCNTNDHVYTTDGNEADVLTRQGTHQYDGPVFRVLGSQVPGSLPLYRFVSAGGRHFLDVQSPSTVDVTARCESILGFVSGRLANGLVPLYLWVHPQNLLFFYTTDPQGESAGQLGYVPRGAGVFVAPR